VRFLTEARVARLQGQVDDRFSMRCDIVRQVEGPELAPGYPAGIVMETLYEDLPCYVWNLLYLLQGEFVFAEREYASGQLRAMLPVYYENPDTGERELISIREQDEIQNIRLHDRTIFEGPLNIFLFVPHALYNLLVLRGQ
jgi:hypothetical protein